MDSCLHILMVDAGSPDGRLVKSVIEQSLGQVRLHTAHTRAHFHEMLAADYYDLILTDHLLPGFTGFDVITEVRRRGLDMPVVMLAANGSEALAVAAMKRGFSDYLVKSPDTVKSIPLALRAVLESAARHRLNRRTQLGTGENTGAEPRWQDLFTDSIEQVLAIVVGDDDAIVYMSQALRQTLGFRREELARFKFSDLITASARAHWERCRERLRSGEELAPLEVTIVNNDGRVITLEGRMSCTFRHGRPEHLRGMFRDITARRQIEDVLGMLRRIGALRQCSFEHRLRQLLECGCRFFNLPLGVVARFTDEGCQIVQAITPDVALRPGDILPLRSADRSEIFTDTGVVAAQRASDATRRHVAWHDHDIEAYLGVPLTVGGRVYGELYFASHKRKSAPFTATDIEVLKLKAQWISDQIASQLESGILQNIIQGDSTATGDEFFRQLVSHLGVSLGVRCVIAAELIDTRAERAKTLAAWIDGRQLNNYEFNLLGTPAAYLVRQARYRYERNVHRRFPEDELLARVAAQSYLGAPMLDATRKTLGLLAVIDDKPLADASLAETIVPIFAARAGVELVRMRAERKLLADKHRAQVTLHSIGDGVITTDAQGVVEYLNPVAELLTGWRMEEAKGRPLANVFWVIDEQSRQRVADPSVRCMEAGCMVSTAGDVLLLDRSGREYAIHGTAAPIRGDEAQVLGVVLVFKDVTETRRMVRQIAHQASHDALTGLANRREFDQRLERAVTTARQHGIDHALAYLDLDQFKIVNDTAGHSAGDALLRQIAGVLAEKIRGRDTLARLGGDEFSLLLENCPIEKAVEITESLLDTIRTVRFVWQDRAFDIGVSIGLVAITPDVDSSAEILSRADVACYTAKDLGRNRVYVYRAHTGEPPSRHTEIMRAAELSDALERGRLSLYCQPIHPLGSDEENPLHYEILLRVAGEFDEEVAAPGLLIAAAERYGMMAMIDRWVIDSAFSAYASLLAGRPDASIAINLSGDSLCDEMLITHVPQALTRWKVPPARVCFEITETAAIRDLEQAGRVIAAIKQLGCRFALDNFGSGLSSLAYLKQLPVDYLKIDGSFVRNMLQNPVDCALVAAINEVGHILKIVTIAECAETDDIVVELKRLGIDYAQGYALGRPVPIADV
ncbi:MAG: EAL domain-containing protein [Gammaproteobacteria bacterium]